MRSSVYASSPSASCDETLIEIKQPSAGWRFLKVYAPSACQMQWYIEGWISKRNSGIVSVSNMPSGTYTIVMDFGNPIKTKTVDVKI